ncbi:hypothetical protein BGZ58_004172, partial [Dissophora ornata]
MQRTQSFRLLRTNDVEEIPCFHVNGEYVVYWDDIEQVFPQLRQVKNGKITVTLMRDLTGKRITPHCIKHHPSIVLEVVPFAVEHVPQKTSVDLLSFQRIPEFQSTVIRELDALQNQGAASHNHGSVTLQTVQKVLKLQEQMIARLVLIQSKTEAIMNQTFSLSEHDIPRLFIVLPETSRSWDPAAMFRTKFRLRFICMGVKRFQPEEGIIFPELHLAKHEGYIIRKQTDLFKKYGPAIAAMLKMVKTGIHIAGNFVPAMSTIDSVTSKGIDYSLKCLETTSRISDDIGINSAVNTAHEDLINVLTGIREVDGPDLRLLKSYLVENSLDNSL